ncbi:MAG TPA: acyltransferase [Vicinamibacteria bacterium]|nr:acyltransferase [Vicinamibacteria bacterium]
MRPLRLALAAAAALRAVAGVRWWSFVARVRLRAHGATLGRRLRVWGPIRLHCHRTASIRIGDDCRIRSGFSGNPVGGGARMALWVGPGGSLRLGDRVGLSQSTIVCLRSVTIEDDALLGGGCAVYDTDFHSLDPEERGRAGNPGARTAPVRIGRRAFVGGHSILLKGATIGEAAVVGAGSVVRSRVPPGQVWAGNPARFVRDLRTPRAPVPAPVPFVAEAVR